MEPSLFPSTLQPGNPYILHHYQQADELTEKNSPETASNRRVVNNNASDYLGHVRDHCSYDSERNEASDDASDNDGDDENDSGRSYLSDDGGYGDDGVDVSIRNCKML